MNASETGFLADDDGKVDHVLRTRVWRAIAVAYILAFAIVVSICR